MGRIGIALGLGALIGCGASETGGLSLGDGASSEGMAAAESESSSSGAVVSGTGSESEGSTRPNEVATGLSDAGEFPSAESPHDSFEGSATTDSGSSGGSLEAPEPPNTFAPCPTDGTPCVIMPLGDSITFGIGSSGGGYRVELFRRTLANQERVTFVGTSQPPNGPNAVDGQTFPRAHQGHSGFTINGGGFGSLAGLVDAAIAASDPHMILLMIGTNDVNLNLDVANAPNRLEALLDQITNDAPEALLVVAQIVPTTNPDTNNQVIAYNSTIPALVEAQVDAGEHVILVDMFTPFVETPNFGTTLMSDFLHPNDAGYVVMGEIWHAAIDPFLPDAP